MSHDPQMTVPLRDYLDAKFETIEAMLDKADEATKLARENLEVRLESLNEWRQQSKDRERDFLARTEFDVRHEKVCEDVRSLRESRAELAGKASQKSVTLVTVLTVVGLLLSAIAIIVALLGK